MSINNNIIYDIISLPMHFNEAGDKSVYTILKETGYADVSDQITVDVIRDALLKYPECVDNWIQYSADKRTSVGWYFTVNPFGKFVVGCLLDEGGLEENQQIYKERREACANFIKREIDSIINH